MFGYINKDKAGPPAQQLIDIKLAELEIRMHNMEIGIVDICRSIGEQIDRIDENVKILDKNMHSLASLTLRPPKDMLGGSEPN